MLNIYYGRESIEKESFIFDSIGKEALVLVPDQFTLAAERIAIKKLKTEGLMDIEILSMSRLGFRVLSELGGTSRTFVDKYGRHILLAKILADIDSELVAFSGMSEKASFIEKMNNLISQLKQFSISPNKLLEIAEKEQIEGLLKRKLKDIYKIYEAYEKRIAGKYIDTEDYTNLFLPKIGRSELIRNREIWIWGFDWFSPQLMDIITELTKYAKVHIVLTCERGSRDKQVFEITEGVISSLKKRATENGIEYCESQIDDKYQFGTGTADDQKSVAIAELEKELFALPQNKPKEEALLAAKNGDIMLVNAANHHAEAETAAAYVLWLVRKKGLKLKDISLICNDLEISASITKRVFEEYGIRLFVDDARGILSNPAIIFVLSLIAVVSNGYRSEDIFRLLKTGFLDLEEDDIEKLENYAIKYKIQGTRWKREFKKGRAEYGDFEFERLESLRKQAIESVLAFDKKYKESKNCSIRTKALYEYLKGEAKLPAKLQEMIDKLEARGENEVASETAQVWEALLEVLKQMHLLLGEENISLKSYQSVLKEGLSAIKIRILPPSTDDLIIGTMQRNRSEEIKALVILGASDGLLPKTGSDEDLLNDDDKKVLLEKGEEILKLSDLQIKEEQLAIYRGLVSPTKYLYLSYSSSDREGKKQRPCAIFTDIKSFFDIVTTSDITSSKKPLPKVQSPRSTVRYLSQELSEAKETGTIDDIWLKTLAWLSKNNKAETESMLRGVFYKNNQEKIEREKIKEIYAKDKETITIGPSALEKYSRCPFSHFVAYALRPEERRKFEIASREIGDIYHECLMRFSAYLTEEGVKVSEPASRWNTITKDECLQIVGEFFDEVAKEYHDGLASSSAEDIYRSGRMKEVLCKNAWALVMHVRAGKIDTMLFETGFGKEKKLPQIDVIAEGQAFKIEGKVDRIDYLEGGNIKIIDYKSGHETIRKEEAECGWRLQLMLYLKATTGEMAPAGVFYFNIKDDMLKVDGLSSEKKAEALEAELASYKLNGLLVDDNMIIDNIAGDTENWNSQYSQIVSGLQRIKSKDGSNNYTYKGSPLMSKEDFAEFVIKFDEVLEKICENLASGNIEAKPKKGMGRSNQKDACRFCPYKGICRFDMSFDGCNYDRINC